MPHRLRNGSGRGLWGIKGLYGKDLIITKLGNIQLRRVVQLIKKLIQICIGGYLENPLTSLIWGAFGILLKQEIRQGFVVFVDTDMCAHGTAWKKPTRLMLWGDTRKDATMPRCKTSNGNCQYTNKPHEQLVGQVGRVWKTSLGQIYPPRFASHLLKQMCQPRPGKPRLSLLS